MNAQKLHPMDAANLKNFITVVRKATDEEIKVAWEKWSNQYSKNQTGHMRARLAKMKKSSQADIEADIDMSVYGER